MARPRKETPITDPLLDDKMTRSEIDIEDFLDEWAPGTSVVEIYQMLKDGSRPHQERVGIDILKEDLYGYIREHFGAGKFLLQFKDAQRKIRKILVVDVAAGKPIAPPLVVGPSSYNSNDSFNRELMLALIAAIRPQPAPDMGTLLAGLGAILAAAKPATMADPSAMLGATVQAFAALKSASTSEDWMEKAQKMIAMAKDLAPGGGEPKEENFYSLLKDVGKVVAEKLAPAPNGSRPLGIPPGAVPVVRALPGENRPSVPPENFMESMGSNGKINPPPEESPDMRLEQWLRAQLQFLKQKANAGKDVEFWIDYVFENQEEPGNQAILEAIRRGARFEHLLQFDPEIGQNPLLKSWFEKLYEALRTELHADVDTPRTGGDASDAGGDAEPRPS